MTEFTDNQYLNRSRRNIAQSQFGEDGIIEKIFEIIPSESQNHWCCEFGAWDGKHCSNTNHLINAKGWTSVLIEANPVKFRDLQATFKGCSKAILVNEFVEIAGNSSLDSILERAGAPKDFDLLSVDIDGNDYHIFKSLERFRPKVIVIEFNPCIPDNIEFVQRPEPTLKQGTSLLAMTKMAGEKGYELICVNAENAFYVVKEFFPLFGIKDNSIAALKYYREPLQVFQLFDGTLVFHGQPHCLYWYSLPVDFNKLQMLPKFVRDAGLPWGGNLFLRAVVKLLRLYRTRFWKSAANVDYGAWKM
ncbi:MAG: FkbM family methyltransferase [Bdellovibrionales bacterium]